MSTKPSSSPPIGIHDVDLAAFANAAARAGWTAKEASEACNKLGRLLTEEPQKDSTVEFELNDVDVDYEVVRGEPITDCQWK